MRQPDCKGICVRCDEYSKELYVYEFISEYGPMYDNLCESCYPKCTLCNSEFAEDEDLCEKCDQAILASEDDEPTAEEINNA